MTQNQSSPRSHLSALAHTAVVALVTTTVFSACAKANSPASPPARIIEKAEPSVGCANFEDEFYDGVYAYLIDKQKLPTQEQMQKAFDEMLSSPRYRGLSESVRHRLGGDLLALFNLITHETIQTTADDPNDAGSALEAVAAQEIGDRTTPAKQALQDKIRAQFREVEKTLDSSSTKLECAPPAQIAEEVTELKDSYLAMIKRTRAPAVYGGIKALMTAYQSCRAPTVDALSTATPDVAGIKVIGLHPDKIGFKREISDLPGLLSSHPYLSNYTKPSKSCFDVTKNPMIYDYGGKPSTTSSSSSRLDFFKDAGSGTNVLGIDCSGYVYSSLAAAGLKVKKSGRLKAAAVSGVSAKMWMNPQSNGLTCFDFVKFNGPKSLRPGDILASHGHVIMVESVGADPFGIAQFTNESECTAANMSAARFDFMILQSSNVKNGIGIDRFRAADYLSAGGDMADAMIEHAVNACLAKTRDSLVTTKAKLAGLVRHLGTAECMDKPVLLAHEECIAACPVN